MQTQTESHTIARTESNPLITFAEYVDPTHGELARQTYDLSQHNDRVKASKLLLWAANHKIELRIRHL